MAKFLVGLVFVEADTNYPSLAILEASTPLQAAKDMVRAFDPTQWEDGEVTEGPNTGLYDFCTDGAYVAAITVEEIKS